MVGQFQKKKKENICSNKNFHTSIQSNVIPNSQKVDTTQMSKN